MLNCNGVIQGDCVEIPKGLPSNSVDFVLTDPPYLGSYKDCDGRTLANDRNPEAVVAAYPELFRVLKPDSSCVTFYGYPKLGAFGHACAQAGFDLVDISCGQTCTVCSSRYVGVAHESAYVLAKGRPRKPTRPLTDVQPWEYTGNKKHPTEKALSVLEPLIRSFSRPEALILHAFAGSGSALIAAALRGRRYLGIELEAHPLLRVRSTAIQAAERKRLRSQDCPCEELQRQHVEREQSESTLNSNLKNVYGCSMRERSTG